jgi:HK97 family phage major capsid protein
MTDTSVLQQKKLAYLNTARGILDRALHENRPLRAVEETDFDQLQMKIDSINRTISKYGSVNCQLVEPNTRGVFVRAVKALGACRGNHTAATEFAVANHDLDLQRALSAGVATGGGFAVPQGYSAEVIEALRPLISVKKLNPVIVPMTRGNLFWPRISTAGTSQYLGENTVIPASQQVFAGLQLTGRRLVSLVPISNTLLRSSEPSADVIVSTDLLASMAATEDYALLRGDGTQFTPRGLRNWILPANVLTSSGSTIAAIESDLSALELLLVNANVRMLAPGYILSKRTEVFLKSLRDPTTGHRSYPEMTKDGLLRGFNYAASTNMPVTLGTGAQTEIILADFADVVVGEFGELIIDVSATGTYTDSTGAQVSAYAQDQSVVRVIAQHDIGMRHQESVAVLTAVSY